MQVLIVIDMQKAVFATPRARQAQTVALINQLSNAADRTIFIQHEDDGMLSGSEGWQLLSELHQPEGSLFITKTACDAFYRTSLSDVLAELGVNHLTICGCATDYCVDATIKNAASRGYALTIAADAHTTSNRDELKAEQLTTHYNDVWRNFIIPGNTITVETTEHIIASWKAGR
ncbi:isochorismatase family protein [Pectobacterium actinidiae]|uniref:isochorismatase family protein n=1 Tax=Pectobacterium actinidiae TaxID=1507808 RepID=UPI0023AB1C90|nr:isochorismatase family protein [Pectobacterium actinidiae]MDY4315441.1 isochorismatase family protein [Pectobacterium actinidiae]WEF10560.1 isochorismatase family protein [Pectobacterium actinidiae]GLW40094.1 isochorismatase [Pectobacterium carotovorum subsp. carotovorum]